MMKVTYIGHSGFLTEDENRYCLFDYYRGSLPALDSGKKMLVFASHAHHDHFQPDIFRLREQFSDIRYILSSDIPADRYEDRGDIIVMAPNEERTASGCRVRTLRSNDQGVAWLVKTETKTIYHAGDLNWWDWEEESDVFRKVIRRTYQSEINKLQQEHIDIAFVPVDPRLGRAYCLGLDWFMKRTDTEVVFPMHFWENFEISDRLMLEPCTEDYRDRIQRIEREGQSFELE